MDQSVTHSLKAQDHKNVVQRIIQSVEKKKTLPKIYLLIGIQMLIAARDAVMAKIVLDCF